MVKIFKSRKNKTWYLKKLLVLFLISFLIAFIFSKIKIFKNKSFLSILTDTGINVVSASDIKLKGEYLLNVGLSSFDKIILTKEVFKEEKNIEGEPKVYIYNTHQTEEYKTIENYNLTPTVHTAAYILKDLLKEEGIIAVVEGKDLKTYMNKLGYDYNNAYRVSRYWLDNLDKKDFSLYIDLHRDSIDYNLSNITIDGKDYAKIMFVLGQNYKDAEKNEETARSIISNIEKIDKRISRGIFIRKNSIYNQDYNTKCVLIELGGPESTYESISNSLKILALAIKNYLGE